MENRYLKSIEILERVIVDGCSHLGLPSSDHPNKVSNSEIMDVISFLENLNFIEEHSNSTGE